MTTVINNPGGESASESASGIILGVVVAIIFIALFVIYGVPALRNNSADTDRPNSTNINVSVPAPVSSDPAPKTN